MLILITMVVIPVTGVRGGRGAGPGPGLTGLTRNFLQQFHFGPCRFPCLSVCLCYSMALG
jgi:hypothetical protein